METEGLFGPIASTVALVQVFPDVVLLGIIRLLCGAFGAPPVIDARNADWFTSTVGDIPRLMTIGRSHAR